MSMAGDKLAPVKIWLSRFVLLLGMGFLYVPILLLVIFSFNESRLLSVWSGFSLRWYSTLWNNQGLLDAALNSVVLAFTSATVATILGTLAGYSLTRLSIKRGRWLLSGLLFAPMVLPEVVTGLALLLAFVALGIDRGLLTVSIAHITFTMAYAAVVVQGRLRSLDPSLEAAAMDLGCHRWQAFWRVTLPLLRPGIAAAWLLSFSLSLDDLVIASFTTGPGATTLPMKVYSSVRLGITPEINALSTLLLGVVASALLLVHYLQARQQT
jgi:putrescine transport system permease protein